MFPPLSTSTDQGRYVGGGVTKRGALHASVFFAAPGSEFPLLRDHVCDFQTSLPASLSNVISSYSPSLFFLLLPSSPPPSSTHPTPPHSKTPVQMCDYANWRRRGWCRLEMCGAVMSRTNVRLMVIKGGDIAPEFLVPEDALHLLPGLGTYTCCTLGHKWGACDKIAGESY